MNPYVAPHTQAHAGRPCPRCGSPYVACPTFTWWGGLVGQRVMGVLKCNSCSYEFVKTSGKDATAAKWTYVIAGGAFVLFLIAFVVGGVVYFAMRPG